MINKIKKQVENKLKHDPKRLEHVIGVYETAIKLAKIYNVDENFVAIASLYHDYTKNDPIEDQIKLLTEQEIIKYKDYPVNYHALSAAKQLEIDFNVKNEEILMAIKSHVWGRAYMSIYEKIVFVSDYCEPNRIFIDTKALYDLAAKDIDLAVLKSMELTLNYLERQDIKPSQEQLIAYAYYMEVNNGKIR
ncbi:MAG: bis(5'-nucleosyl)-tetraphosphatase (symmetrical) YqeK [Acholeplasmataceae bacterium]|nr:bis(5'-nucleosyl)-tetraphosphatase (symmetrical) YqeK [Acholeplasmataceae bacterium]